VATSITDFHGPAIDVANVTPTSAFANSNEIATDGGAGFHHGRNAIFTPNEFIGVAKDSFARGEPDYFIIICDAFFKLRMFPMFSFPFGKKHSLKVPFSPHSSHFGILPGIVDGVARFGGLFSVIVFTECDIIARIGKIFFIKRSDVDITPFFCSKDGGF